MWCTGEAVNYSAGLGFNGYDEAGRSKWNLLDNAEIYFVEVPTDCELDFIRVCCEDRTPLLVVVN